MGLVHITGPPTNGRGPTGVRRSRCPPPVASTLPRRWLRARLGAARIRNERRGGRPTSDVTQSAARAQERYYSSYGEPRPIDAGTAAARPQERYYSSFGEPEPLTQSPSPSDYPPLLAIALSIAITLVIVTACATHLRRLRVRRRRAAGVAT